MEVQKKIMGKSEPKNTGRLPKMELPNFDGENPRKWVRKANKYFQIHGVKEEMKSEIVELYFRDKVDIWFHGMFSGGSLIPWPELSVAMSERLGEGTRRSH